ncbi:MAG: ribonuclease P protein component [Saprospiraceae bacterium]|jgi:ribonuclease P protein component
MHDYTFPATERLKSRKIISTLFQKEKSKSFGAYPLRLVWIAMPEADPGIIQVAFSVPKRSFRKANQRNTIRRRIKEAYRLHKNVIQSPVLDKAYGFMWIFTAKEEMNYQAIEKSMQLALQRWIREHQTGG